MREEPGIEMTEAEKAIEADFKKGQPRTRTQAFLSALTLGGTPQEFMLAFFGFAAMLSTLVIFGSLVIALGFVALGGVVGTGTGAGIAMVVARDVAIVTGVAFVAASPFVAVAVSQGLLSPKRANLAELGKGIDKSLEQAVETLRAQGAGFRKSLTAEGKEVLSAVYKELESKADNFPAADKRAYIEHLNGKFVAKGITLSGGSVVGAKSLLAGMSLGNASGELNVVSQEVLAKVQSGNVNIAGGEDPTQHDVQLAVLRTLSDAGRLRGLMQDQDNKIVINEALALTSGSEYASWLANESAIEAVGPGSQNLSNQEALNGALNGMTFTLSSHNQRQVVEFLEADTAMADAVSARRGRGPSVSGGLG